MAAQSEMQTENTKADRRDPSPTNKFRRAVFGVPMTVTISIGRQKMSVTEILELRPESVVPLRARIDDPFDLAIDDRTIARGDLIETDDGGLAIRITEIVEDVGQTHG